MYKTFEQAIPLAQKFVDFVNQSKSPWHAVNTVRLALEAKGYQYLSERNSWNNLAPNGKYYFTRNQSTIIAFAIGGKYQVGNGIKIIGAHTDSPDLKLKPISAQESQGYLQVGVQCYGGGLWHTWFDRDLTIAGRVLVKSKDGSIEHKLVEIKKPILRIPSLAIHLNREVSEGFKFNNETHLLPIIGTAVKEQLEQVKNAKHQPLLLGMMAKELECNVEDIKDFEVSVVDNHPATIGGAQEEFVFAPRIDNLMSCFCALEAFLQTDNSISNDEDIRLVAFFDHEEIGSSSAQGAAGSLISDLFQRITTSLSSGKESKDVMNLCLANSFIVSSDMAHAVHPNYPEKHQANHRPKIHSGCVIKYNSNQRYATTAVSALVMKELAQRHNIPLQEFVVRNDSACGSTIGPILASKVGVRTVDLGIPQLSMHSIREQCGTVDISSTVDLYKAFFEEFSQVDQSIKVD